MLTRKNLSSNILFFLLITIFIFTIRCQVDDDDDDTGGTELNLDFIQFEWRKWPEQFNDISKWGNYVLYLVLVFFAPLATGILFSILMCIGYVLSAFFEAPYGKLKNKLCLGSFTVLYIVLIIVTSIALIFLIVVYGSYRSLKIDGLDFIKNVFNLPENTKQSFDEILKIIPDIEDEVVNVVDELNRFSTTFEKMLFFVNETEKKTFNNVPPILDEINSNFQQLEKHMENVIDCGWDVTNDLPGWPEEYYFPNGTCINDLENAQTQNVYSNLQGYVFLAEAGISTAQTLIGSSVGTFGGIFEIAFDQLRYYIDLGVKRMAGGMDAIGFNETGLNRFDKKTIVVEQGFLIGFSSFYLIFVLFFTFALFCMCKSGTFLFLLSGCACCGVLLYFILGSIILILFFMADDICDQTEYTLARTHKFASDNFINFVRFDFPTFGGGAIHCDLINMSLNILHCGQPDNSDVVTYFDAVGITLEALNFSRQFYPYVDEILSGLANFDYINLTQGVQDSMQAFLSSSSDIPSELVNDLNQLDNYLTTNFFGADDLDRFGISQGYYQTNESAGLSQFNQLTFTQCGIDYNFVRNTIASFDTDIDPWLTDCGVWDNSTKNYVEALQVVLVDYANIYNTKIQYVISNLTVIDVLLQLLKDNVTLNEQILREVIDIPVEGSSLLNEIQDIYGIVQGNISDIIPSIERALSKRLRNSSLLMCTSIGDFYTSLVDKGCGSIITSLGIVGFCTVFLAVLFFVMFWVLIYTGSMLKDFDKNFVNESDLYDTESLDERDERERRRSRRLSKGGGKRKRKRRRSKGRKRRSRRRSRDDRDSFSDESMSDSFSDYTSEDDF